jgi:hypothetical protein
MPLLGTFGERNSREVHSALLTYPFRDAASSYSLGELLGAGSVFLLCFFFYFLFFILRENVKASVLQSHIVYDVNMFTCPRRSGTNALFLCSMRRAISLYEALFSFFLLNFLRRKQT